MISIFHYSDVYKNKKHLNTLRTPSPQIFIQTPRPERYPEHSSNNSESLELPKKFF